MSQRYDLQVAGFRSFLEAVALYKTGQFPDTETRKSIHSFTSNSSGLVQNLLYRGSPDSPERSRQIERYASMSPNQIATQLHEAGKTDPKVKADIDQIADFYYGFIEMISEATNQGVTFSSFNHDLAAQAIERISESEGFQKQGLSLYGNRNRHHPDQKENPATVPHEPEDFLQTMAMLLSASLLDDDLELFPPTPEAQKILGIDKGKSSNPLTTVRHIIQMLKKPGGSPMRKLVQHYSYRLFNQDYQREKGKRKAEPSDGAEGPRKNERIPHISLEYLQSITSAEAYVAPEADGDDADMALAKMAEIERNPKVMRAVEIHLQYVSGEITKDEFLSELAQLGYSPDAGRKAVQRSMAKIKQHPDIYRALVDEYLNK